MGRSGLRRRTSVAAPPTRSGFARYQPHPDRVSVERRCVEFASVQTQDRDSDRVAAFELGSSRDVHSRDLERPDAGDPAEDLMGFLAEVAARPFVERDGERSAHG